MMQSFKENLEYAKLITEDRSDFYFSHPDLGDLRLHYGYGLSDSENPVPTEIEIIIEQDKTLLCCHHNENDLFSVDSEIMKSYLDMAYCFKNNKNTMPAVPSSQNKNLKTACLAARIADKRKYLKNRTGFQNI